MMDLAKCKKTAESSLRHDAGRKTATVCYICGKERAAESELCAACAGIIGNGLKLLRKSKTVC